MSARLVALLIGVLALASLRGQYDVIQGSMADRLWGMLGYFTVLTNLIVAAAMLAVARKWQMSAPFAAGLVVSIVVVAVTYHVLLAGLRVLTGPAWWADQGLHTAVPLAVCGWWLAFANKDIGWRDLPKWLIWPTVYGVYAVVRGNLTGFWAYPFVDVTKLGAIRVAFNSVAMIAAFAVLGAGLIGVARLVRMRGSARLQEPG